MRSLLLLVALLARPAWAANCSASGARYRPSDTPCSDRWTKEEGVDIEVKFNIAPGVQRSYGTVRSCVYYEVCAPELDKYVERASDCCVEGSTDVSARCRAARRKGGASGKACRAWWLVDGQNDLGTKLNPYDLSGPACCAAGTYPEWAWWCQALSRAPDTRWTGSCGSPGGQGNGSPSPLHSSVASMNCRPDLRYRPTGANSCMSMLFGPTSVVTERTKNAGCTNDAAVLTTLLRKAGYAKDEVMTVAGYYHYFTIAKIPGAGGFVVGEKADMTPAEMGPVCEMEWVDCHNDAGSRRCPDKRQVVGCGAERTPPSSCDGCEHAGACHPIGAEACVGGERHRCVARGRTEYLGRCCTDGCLYSGQCYVPGQTDCVAGQRLTCAGPNDLRTGGRCGAEAPPTRGCGTGCFHDGDCFAAGETKCVAGQIWRCDGRDEKRVVGLCCPGGCLYNSRCYRPGETECVDGQLWRCAGEERRERTGASCRSR